MQAVHSVPAPATPRTDQVEVFLTGVCNRCGGPVKADLNSQMLNRDVKAGKFAPSEQLRLDMKVAPSDTPNRPGVVGGDLAGFPNGRRLADDVPAPSYCRVVMSETPRTALLQMREQTEAEIVTLDGDLRGLFEATRSANADDEHDPEGSTIAYERAQLTAVLDAARRHLADIDEALRRLEAGTYGGCERCGTRIPAERLAVRPFARTCVGCAT
jgi:DnaK suppressor protein